MTELIGTDIQHAAALLEDGGLVAFATETVYGLGAAATNPEAVAKVFAAKGRPTFDPLIVHVANVDQLPAIVAEIPASAQTLIDAFWPGPLTLLFQKREIIPDLVTAGLPTVAVRIPSHPQALELLAAFNLPIAAPSANRFGCISPTTASHVAEQLGNEVDYILDGGPCSVGLESTIVSCLGETPEVLRLGGLSLEQIESVVGNVTFRQSSSDPGGKANQESAQLAPGMLQRHYAPGKPMIVVDSLEEVELQPTDALLLPKPETFINEVSQMETLSATGDLTECAINFFAGLRRLDAGDGARIVAVRFPEGGLGRALNDRLRRASAK